MATLSCSVLGADYNDVADGNWSADATWSGSGYPDDSGDTATIDDLRTVTVDVSPTIGGLTLSGLGTSWTLADGASANTLTIGALSIENEGTIGSSNTLSLTSGSHSWTVGKMDNFGTINVQSGATLAITSANHLYQSGTLDVDAGGTMTWNHGGGFVSIRNSIINDGLMVFAGSTKRWTTASPGPLNISGTGTFRVEESAQIQLQNSPTVIEGWSGSGAFNSLATWHMNGNVTPLRIPGDFPNLITSIGPSATVILENGGRMQELNDSARDALTVYGKLYVRGAQTNLQFNSGQSLTIASGGTLGGTGTVVVAGVGQVDVQSGGTLAAEVSGPSSTRLTVSGGNLVVSGFLNVSYLSAPTANEYCIAIAASITSTATVTGVAGWTSELRNGNTELWIVLPPPPSGTLVFIH